MSFEPSPAALQAIQATATSTAGTSPATMLGIGAGSTPLAVITPQVTGRSYVGMAGLMTNTNGNGCQAQLSFGTGGAPALNAALTGTQIGQVQAWTSLTGALTGPFVCQAVITGLAVPSVSPLHVTGSLVPVWLDLAVNVITGGAAVFTKMNICAFEF